MAYHDDIRNAALAELPWHKLQGKNILVTGATGLIGSTIVEILMSRPSVEFNVYASGRNEERAKSLFKGYWDLVNFHFLKHDVTQPLDCCIDFHFIIDAASGANPVLYSTHPVDVMKANFNGVDNLLSYGKNHSLERLLYVSSGDVYGEGDGRIFTEDYSGYVNPLNIRSCYTSSKRASETLCISYGVQYGIDVVIARPCHTYGPNFTKSDTRVYAQFIRNVLRGEDIVMKSSGEQFRSWCYSVDCALGILYVLLKGNNGEAYNIADDNSNISIRELAEIIANIGGKKVVFEQPNDIEKIGFNLASKSVFDTAKLKKLGWHTIDCINNGLEKTINAVYEKIRD